MIAQNQNFDSDQYYENVKNLCFDQTYKEVIKVNKHLNVNTLTTLDKLTFKEKTYSQRHHRFLSTSSYPVHEIKYRSWYNIFPKWYTVANVIKTDETGTRSYFMTKNKYLRNDWYLDLDPNTYHGYYGIDEISGSNYYYMMPHTQVSLTSYTQEKEIIEKVGYLTFYRYSYPTTAVLQEFVRQGFVVSQNTRYIIVTHQDIRITWDLEEKIITRELLVNNTVTKTTISTYKYFEKFGQYLLYIETDVTPEIFENGDCYDIVATTKFENYDDQCLEDKSFVDVRTKSEFVSTLEVMPNPAQDFINIKIPYSENHTSSIEILDQMGRVITGTDIAQNISAIKMDINTLHPGIYFVKFKQGGHYYNSKFVKQ
ncbi:MAG TPA: T9SS type A sorting domain-containing protein [Saprospiraceae bacterium]|jgi:hypothetical protein|nr:T9SS type A sorting domain-containing protein [Saprospiraceae bacterium]